MDLLTECNIPILNDCLEEGAGVLCSRTYVVNKLHLLDHLQRHFIVFWNDLILVCSESTRVHSCLLFHVRWRHSVVEYLLAFAVGLCITNFFHNHIFHNNFLWSIKKWCSKGETHNSKSKVSWLRSILLLLLWLNQRISVYEKRDNYCQFPLPLQCFNSLIMVKVLFSQKNHFRSN